VKIALTKSPEKNSVKGWLFVPLNEVAEINPKIDKTNLDDDLLVTFVPMQAVGAGDGKIDTNVMKPFSEVKRGYTPFQSGDVLFAKITPCMENGKIVVVPELRNKIGFGSTEFHVLRSTDKVDSRYLYYYLSRSDFRREAASKMTGAVGQKRVPADFIKLSKIPLAPLTEQKLIVSEIEKQFSRLDEAVAALKRIKANLKRYKASVLKAAVEGKLTEEWRKEHSDIEPASELLKRILAERRKKWEKEHPGKKYKEPAEPDTSNLPVLPKGWVWVTVEQLSNNVQYGSSSKTNNNQKGIPVLRMGNIVDGRLVLNNLKYLPKKHPEFPELLLKNGDLLFNRTNSPELVGKTAIYKGHPEPCSFASYLIRVQVVSTLIPNIIAYYINSLYGRKWIKSVVSQQVGQANVNGTKLQALLIPVPPEKEQIKIVEEVERSCSIAEEIETAIEADLARAEHLRQSILKKAFKGKLMATKEESCEISNVE
jgi:type I restriction enzyme S subunit